MENSPSASQAAATRKRPLTRSNARPSTVAGLQTTVLAPPTSTSAYDGRLVESPTIIAPSRPNTFFHTPLVVAFEVKRRALGVGPLTTIGTGSESMLVPAASM